MMGLKERTFAPLVAVSLEALVPPDHFYRHLDRTLDLSFVRDLVQDTYAPLGRPSIDPVVFFRLQLVMFFEGIRSERLLMRLVADKLSVRWFVGYDLNEPLPDHSSLARIRTRYGLEVFRRFFDAIVEQCHQAKLIWGKELYVDATQVNANADLDSLTPRFAVEERAAMKEHLDALFSEGTSLGSYSSAEETPLEADKPPLLPMELAEEVRQELTVLNEARHDWIAKAGQQQREVTNRNYQRLADLKVSTTDPDASPMRLKGGGARLGYHTHYVVDGGKQRVILGVLVTPAEVMENQPILDLLWRVRFRWKVWPRQVTGDSKYGTTDVIVGIEREGIHAFVSLTDLTKRTPFFRHEDFHYDAERDVYICPAGKELPFCPHQTTERSRRYRARAKDCNHCPLKSRCTTSKQGRSLCRSVQEQYLDRVRAYHQTEAYQKAYRKRRVWVEPLFAEAKDWHGMRRFRLRRLWRVNGEALMIAAGQNLKRLLSKSGWGRRPLPSGAAIHLVFLCWMLGIWSVQIILTAWQGYPPPAAAECSLASHR